jgi:hypothetical protein
MQPPGIALRCAGSILGGYAVVYTLTSALAAGLLRALPVSRADAALLATTLAFLAYPAVAIWAFAVRRAWLAAVAPVLISLALGLAGLALAP